MDTIMTAPGQRVGRSTWGEDIFGGRGVEVRLPSPDAFLKVKETLTRVGIQEGTDTLLQPCFILHKRGRYAIVHEAELGAMDGETVLASEMSDAQAIRNTVAALLHQWELVEIVDRYDEEHRVPVHQLKIVPHRSKSQWKLKPLYEIGRR